MTYIHKKLFHGDLKALNVLVEHHQADLNDRNKWQYELKISAFCVSDRLVLKENHTGLDSDCTSFTTANVGTTRWRAPEVFDVTEGDLMPYSMIADVYSVGMTCIDILTRQVPFHYLPKREIREHVQAGRRPKFLPVPEKLRKLIVRCWDHDPARSPDFSKICTYLEGLKEHSTLDMEMLDPLDLEPDEEEMGNNPVFQSRVKSCHCSIM